MMRTHEEQAYEKLLEEIGIENLQAVILESRGRRI